MVRRIESEVAKNSSGRLRLDASFIATGANQSPGEGGESLIVTRNRLGVAVGVELYTRALGSDAEPALVLGHPDPAHGVGRGAVEGDAGGGWERVAEPDASLTTAARSALMDALVAPDGKITSITVGDAGADAGSGASGTTRTTHNTYAYGVLDAGSEPPTALARGIYRFHEHGSTVADVEATTADGTTVADGTTSQSLTDDQELRVDVRLTVTPDAIGDTTFTDAGERALAGSLVRSDTAIALAAVAIGTGTGATGPSDTTLVAPLDTKDGGDAEAVLAPGRVAIRARWSRGQPDDQPATIREIGVLDSDGGLVWRAEIQPTEKSDTSALTAGMALTLREQ